MIQGNYDNKIAYVHTSILWAQLFIAGWYVSKGDLIAADDVAVEVAKSTESNGYWHYLVWAPTAGGHRVLIKLLEFDLFPTAIEASLDHLTQEKSKQLLRFARCYHHKKQGWFSRLFKWWGPTKALGADANSNFLAKKHQASALQLPARPENTPGGITQPARLLGRGQL